MIGAKAIPRAIDRNRLRRRFREILRSARPAIEQYDVILRVKRTVARDQILVAVAEGRALVEQLLVASVA